MELLNETVVSGIRGGDCITLGAPWFTLGRGPLSTCLWPSNAVVTMAVLMVVSNRFSFSSFCCSRRPQYLGCDNGSEFKNVFQEMAENYGQKRKGSTPYNPQSNGIVERVHQVLNDMLRTFELENQQLDDTEPWKRFLAAASFAIRSTYHTTLGATPAQLVYNRDMLLPIQFNFKWADIKMRRQKEMARNNKKENKSRIPHIYNVGDKVSLDRPGKLRKLSIPKLGPFQIERVHNNGTVTIRRGPVTERVNIRRVHPFFE